MSQSCSDADLGTRVFFFFLGGELGEFGEVVILFLFSVSFVLSEVCHCCLCCGMSVLGAANELQCEEEC